MSICIATHDLPLGVTPLEAASLVLGAERAANDVLILVATETDDGHAWEQSMRKRLSTDPTPEVVAIVREMDDLLACDPIGPQLSQQPAVPLSEPADCRSVDKSTAPLKPEHRGLEFADVRIKAQERGLNLTQAEHGYRLQNKHGAIVRKQLGELLEVINHSPKDCK